MMTKPSNPPALDVRQLMQGKGSLGLDPRAVGVVVKPEAKDRNPERANG